MSQLDQSAFAARVRTITEELAELLRQKNRAYGDSFAQSEQFMVLLFPSGVPRERLRDALLLARVWDKIKRIATSNDPTGENPWSDLAGYAVLALELAERDRERDDKREEPGEPGTKDVPEPTPTPEPQEPPTQPAAPLVIRTRGRVARDLAKPAGDWRDAQPWGLVPSYVICKVTGKVPSIISRELSLRGLSPQKGQGALRASLTQEGRWSRLLTEWGPERAAAWVAHHQELSADLRSYLSGRESRSQPSPAESDRDQEEDHSAEVLAKLRPDFKRRSRRAVVLPSKLTRAEKAEMATTDADDEKMPRTRGECADGPRPCPWVRCRHHLGVHVTDAGSISLPQGTDDVAAMRETCSLDIAEREDGMTLDQISDLVGVTRERVRQIEDSALAKVRRRAGGLEAA